METLIDIPLNITSYGLYLIIGLDDILDVLLSDDSLTPNVDARDAFGGQTPLYLAAKEKKEECVKLLIGKGADLNVRCGKDNLTVRQVISIIY
jgi:ankyrin repeat protein